MSVGELFQAIDNNNTDLALSMLNTSDLNVNQKVGRYGFTCLNKACERGNSDVTRALIEAGAHIDVGDNFGQRPIHWAASRGSSDCMSMLIKQHCDINLQTVDYGSTPLHYSSHHGHSTCTEMLLQENCQMDVFNHRGMTALHEAADNDQLEIVKLLVQHGADVDMKVSQRKWTRGEHLNKTAGQLAEDNGHINITQYLEHGKPLHCFMYTFTCCIIYVECNVL